MEAVRQKCRPKHQVLVLKCFPRYQKGVLEVKPNGSELSYLLYYASTRRSKLQKVGAFLEKKAARDVSRGRLGNVQVTLHILAALIEKLPRELPLYGHSVLNVLAIILHSRDISMVEETLQTFETFCSHQDLAILAAEQRYALQYEDIVRSYASFASHESAVSSRPATTSLPIRLRWKNIGLKAIKSIVSSEGVSADGGKQLSCIVPVIMENVYEGGEELLQLLLRTAQETEKPTTEQIKRRRASTVTVQTVDTAEGNIAEASGTTDDADKVAEMEVRLLAIKCLERIFTVSSNRPQIRSAAGLVLQFIVSRHDLQKPKGVPQDYVRWAKSLMDIITKWCPVQDRFIVLFTAVEILRGISADGQPVGQQIVLASLIDSLLRSPINMIGLSVIDVLVGFVQHILRLLQAPLQTKQPVRVDAAAALDTETSEMDQQESPLTADHVKLASLLKKCIGSLATHTYYADQISDMVLTILRRIRPLAPSDASGGSSSNAVSDPAASTNNMSILTTERQAENCFYTSASRVVALEAVRDILLVANHRKTPTGPEIEQRNRVGLHIWEGTQWLLRESDRQVRNAYADALLSWLQLETTRSDLKVPDSYNRLSRAHTKRDTGTTSKRITSSMVAEKAHSHSSSVFLQLLHLSLYETAVEYADSEEDILVVYTLLVQMAIKLGVNAVRFGLPMVLKLQSESFTTISSQVNIGSLVYGYLAALTEHFEFDTSRIAGAISSEMSRRKSSGAWLETVRFPPLPVDQIPLSTNDSTELPNLQEPLRAFTAVGDLVKQIEEAYNASLAMSQSPPSSPGRHASSSSSSPQNDAQGYIDGGQVSSTLPVDAKEDMLSAWSKDTFLAVLERENGKALSVVGSRTGTTARRSYKSQQPNGYGFHISNDGDSPNSINRKIWTSSGPAPGSSSSSQGFQRQSIGFSAEGASSRDSTIRVNDLKRMLTVTRDSKVRRSSPLRGRLDASNNSILTSSSESFVSGNFSGSDFDPESRPQSVRERSETPKATQATTRTSSSVLNQANNRPGAGIGTSDHDAIPPVPPLPSGLVIPGGYPETSSTNLSRQSSSRSVSRSSVTAPAQSKGKINGSTTTTAAVAAAATSRSATNLRKSSGVRQSYGTTDGALQNDARLDVETLLDSVQLRDNNTSTSASASATATATATTATTIADEFGLSFSSHDQNGVDRKVSGGIGKPPY